MSEKSVHNRQPLVEDRLGLRARVREHERALLVSLQTRQSRFGRGDESLLELHTLCRTDGVDVVHTVVQRRVRPHPATFIYKGKIEDVRAMAEAGDVTVVIFDDELTPAQSRNLEERLQIKIVDRAQLIMDIFAQRATTNDAKLQVELAQLKYLLPRLRGWGQSLSRLGGGIGTRGPGETKLTVERRQLRRRIHRLQASLNEAKLKRDVNRKQRARHELPQLVLLGYTNTGKSTLLNRLTQAEVDAQDKLFATLDPVARRLTLPDQSPAILSDTVGFIRKLPQQLVPAFQSTLESVQEADLILHVMDASDPGALAKWEAVRGILQDVLALNDWPPLLHVLNKVDAINTPEANMVLAQAKAQLPHSVEISALHGGGVGALLERVVAMLGASKLLVRFNVPYAQGQWLDRLHRLGEVQAQRYSEEHTVVEVILPSLELDKLATQAAAEGLTWDVLKS